MGVRGLFSYIRKEQSNFRPIQLRDSFIIFDGHNIINKLYLNSPLYTQYNGEYFGFDIIVEKFLLNLRKCNLEPIFVFDGLHEVCDFLIHFVTCALSDSTIHYFSFPN